MVRAKDLVSTWEGRLYFVYLPTYDRYSKNIIYNRYEEIIETVNEMNIPFIDMHKEVFEPHKNLLSLFPNFGGHYNTEGHRLVAESIRKRLKDDQILPLN